MRVGIGDDSGALMVVYPCGRGGSRLQEMDKGNSESEVNVGVEGC